MKDEHLKKCRFCLLIVQDNNNKNNLINCFSEEGKQLQITKIVSKHFWFEINPNDGLPIGVCRKCWFTISEFNDFYDNTKSLHDKFPLALVTVSQSDNGNHIVVQHQHSTDNGDNRFVTVFDNDSHHVKSKEIESSTIGTIMENLNVINTINNEIKIENYNRNDDHDHDHDMTDPYNKDQDQLLLLDNNKVFRKKSLRKRRMKKPIKPKQRKQLKQLITTECCNDQSNAAVHHQAINDHDKDVDVIINEDNYFELDEDLKIIKKSRTARTKPQPKIHCEPKILVNEIHRQSYSNSNDHQHSSSSSSSMNDKLKLSQNYEADDLKIREFYNLTCQLCTNSTLTTYESFTDINAHYKIVHNLKRGYILCCNKKIFGRGSLLEHMCWHINPDDFRCSVCNKLYSDKYGLKLHMHIHVSPADRLFSCDICEKRFTLKYHLKQHFNLTHIPNENRIYKCNECNKSFGLNSVLQSHIRGVHQFKNSHICHVCAKVFKSKLQCDIHSSEHFNRARIQCQLCGAFLKNVYSLKSHVRRSHQEQPIECTICHRISPNREALRSHMKYVHVVQASFKCTFCDKAFKKSLSLKEHLAGHTGTTLYTCLYCPKTFNSNANMHSHKKKVHQMEWQEERNKRKVLL